MAAVTADDFPELGARPVERERQRVADSKNVALNYKASLLTAIDGRMQDEQERLRRTQRKQLEDRRELYEKMKYDDDRAATARAASHQESTFIACADDEEEDARIRHRRIDH